MLYRALTLALLLCLSMPLLAAPDFPRLKGRVMDRAGLLKADTEVQLSQLLAAHEKATSNQVVVVTLPDLQGYSIAEFGYQLGRHWGIGQKDKNNGVVLLVAKAERKVRIEVGYGLEGALTDALAGNIIQTVITPRFKRGNFDGGVYRGVEAILAAIKGEYKSQAAKKGSGNDLWKLLLFIPLFWFFVGGFRSSVNGRRRYRHGGYYGGGFGAGRGGFGGGGFSGGGGGFGGGGASGGW